MGNNEDKGQEQLIEEQLVEKQQSEKYHQIERRKKMLTHETKKVVGGIILQKRETKGIHSNHNEIFVNI